MDLRDSTNLVPPYSELSSYQAGMWGYFDSKSYSGCLLKNPRRMFSVGILLVAVVGLSFFHFLHDHGLGYLFSLGHHRIFLRLVVASLPYLWWSRSSSARGEGCAGQIALSRMDADDYSVVTDLSLYPGHDWATLLGRSPLSDLLIQMQIHIDRLFLSPPEVGQISNIVRYPWSREKEAQIFCFPMESSELTWR